MKTNSPGGTLVLVLTGTGTRTAPSPVWARRVTGTPHLSYGVRITTGVGRALHHLE
ncbi:MAG: hypothetical protein JO308_06180 [Verrucomicrobia bacterium]|nr:hypothetical protein [Verrucomicrobiota bacterium]